MGRLDQAYEALLQRLNQLRKRQKRMSALRGALFVLAVVAGLVMAAHILEAVFHFVPAARISLLVLVGCGSLAAVAWFIGRPLFSLLFRPNQPGDVQLALQVGQKNIEVKDRLADALEVFLKHQDNREGYSLELADRSLATVYSETKSLDFKTIVSLEPVRKAARQLLALAGAVVLLLLIFSSSLTRASYRLSRPTVAFVREIATTLEVSPGNVEIVKGESIEITATVKGEPVPEAILFVKNAEAREFDRILLNSDGADFSHRLEKIINDKQYFFKAGGHETDRFSVAVVELPFVRGLQLTLDYPRYSRLGHQLLDENVGDVSALRGTSVGLSLQTNKTVAAAQIVFDDGGSLPLNISGQEVSGNFSLTKNGSYHVELEDRKALKNDAPIEYRLSVVDDQYPIVEIPFPGQDVDLDKEMLLQLSVDAQDDFGISKARLGYRILQQGVNEGALTFIDLPVEAGASDKLLINHNWDLSGIGIFPEDVVTYFAEVFDNDAISGPKSTRSPTYRVRFPSIYEMYEEVTSEHEETIDELEEIFEETNALKETIAEVVQQMKRDPELNWEEKQEVQEAVSAQGKVREELQDLQQKLEEMVTRMEQNDLVSPETLEKYRELQELMEEMLSEDLREAMEKLQSQMEELDPKQLKDAMEKMAASQEDFLKSMERTLNLLKKLQVEQKLDESLRKAQDLLRRQDELNKNASESQGAEQQQKYAEEQEGIRKDTDDLSKDLDDLKKKMSEFPQMEQPQNKVEAAQSQLGENGLQQDMQQASQQFQSGQMQSGQKSGQKASQGLQQMVQSLEDAQQQLSQQEKQRIMQALKRSSHDLLSLSKKQESLRQKTSGSDRNTPGLGEMADQQQDMQSGLNRVTQQLYELSQNTFFVTSDIGKALGKASQGMQGAVEGLESRNPGQSGKQQSQAMAGLNDAASQLRSSMQGLSGSSSAIGFQEMMQKMMGLSGQQEGINQQTQGMGQGQKQGGLSMEQQAAMSRLAAEQEAVRKSLQQLMRESGKRSDVLGDLGKIGDDMKKVVEDMQRQNLNRNTITRQKRILSRMLDAQRSMHDRDYSRKRKAETGKTYQALNPAALPEMEDAERERLKNELLKAMKEGYSKDYKELIQKYFEALAAEKETDGGANN